MLEWIICALAVAAVAFHLFFFVIDVAFVFGIVADIVRSTGSMLRSVGSFVVRLARSVGTTSVRRNIVPDRRSGG